MEIIPKPNKKQLDLLREGLINKVLNYGKHNAVFNLKDGNIIYTLLFCKEGLILYGRLYNYSKCIFKIKSNKMREDLKQVLMP